MAARLLSVYAQAAEHTPKRSRRSLVTRWNDPVPSNRRNRPLPKHCCVNTWHNEAVPLANRTGVRGRARKTLQAKTCDRASGNGTITPSILKETDFMNRIKLALIAGGALFAA